MVDKIITLQLGGQERTLLFGAMGYFTHIKEVTGMEPFEWLSEFDKKRTESADGKSITVLIDDIAVLIYAGLNSNLDNLDQPNVPMDKVKKWCNGITIEKAAAVCTTAFGTLQTTEPGEQVTQPNGVQETQEKV